MKIDPKVMKVDPKNERRVLLVGMAPTVIIIGGLVLLAVLGAVGAILQALWHSL